MKKLLPAIYPGHFQFIRVSESVDKKERNTHLVTMNTASDFCSGISWTTTCWRLRSIPGEASLHACPLTLISYAFIGQIRCLVLPSTAIPTFLLFQTLQFPTAEDHTCHSGYQLVSPVYQAASFALVYQCNTGHCQL